MRVQTGPHPEALESFRKRHFLSINTRLDSKKTYIRADITKTVVLQQGAATTEIIKAAQLAYEKARDCATEALAELETVE